MKHLYLPFRCHRDNEITLSGHDYHYLVNVLRFKEGTSFYGLDAGNRRFVLTIEWIGDNSLTLTAREAENQLPELPGLLLFQAIPKGKGMDRIIRQATEAGVSGIIPVLTEHTVVSLKSDFASKGRHKMERWGRIAREAVQQSGSLFLPYLFEPQDFEKALTHSSGTGIKLFFHQEKKENRTLHECLSAETDEISLFIGPEGGFSDFEYNFLKNSGFIPINLGGSVLRVDTAAVSAIAAVKIILLEKKRWRIV